MFDMVSKNRYSKTEYVEKSSVTNAGSDLRCERLICSVTLRVVVSGKENSRAAWDVS